MKTIIAAFLLDPTTIGTVLAILAAIVALIVRRRGERAKAIVHFALQAFLEAEKIIPDNRGPAWLQKTDKALKSFNSLYRSAFGYDVPESVTDAAKRLWTAWAAQQKGLITTVKS